MQIINKKVKDLLPADYNPRKISKKQLEDLESSMDRFGYVEPIIWNERTGHIIGGHQRFKVIQKKMGPEDEIQVVRLDIDEFQEKALNIALNKISGEWDDAQLKALLDNINSHEPMLLDFTGFDQNELLNILSEKEEKAQSSKPLEPKYKVNPGEVWILGDHKVMCGDATKEEDVDKLTNGLNPVLMVTDPPYGVNYDPSWRDQADKKGILKNKYPTRALGKVQNDEIIDWSKAYELFRGDVVYIWHAGKYAAEVQRSIEKCNFEIISQIIWVKPHFALSRGDYHWQHEPCWYASRKGKSHNWQGSRKETTVWSIAGMNAMGGSKDEADKTTGHGTQKPIDCMRFPIRNNTKEGDHVYDPFGGSGSTLIACELTKRCCLMMEIDPFYCSLIIERWENYTGKKANVQTQE